MSIIKEIGSEFTEIGAIIFALFLFFSPIWVPIVTLTAAFLVGWAANDWLLNAY